MQSRNFFTFGPTFNVLTDSLFSAQAKIDGTSIPPSAEKLITENSDPFITEDGNNFIVE